MLRLTITGGRADVVQKIHYEVQINQLVVKAVVVQFEQLLVFSAQLRVATLRQSGLILAACLYQRTLQSSMFISFYFLLIYIKTETF